MRILFDLTPLAHNFSGIERYEMSLTMEFIQKNCQNNYILVFNNEIHQEFTDIVKKKNVEHLVLKGKNRLIFQQIILAAGLYRCKADAYVFLAFREPILFFRKNILSAVHDIGWLDCPGIVKPLRKLYSYVSLKKSLRFCNKIITVSEFSKSRITDVGHIEQERVKVIPSAVSELFVHPCDISKGILNKYGLPDEYMLTLSTLEPRKNLPLLIEAYDKLSQTEQLPDLVLVGRKGWMMDDFLASIDSRIKQRLHFTGFVDDEDLPAIYRGAEFFVFPSKYEGFGLPPLEAMACGVPVLSSDAASMPEVLGDAAMYFKSEDVNSLSEKLQEMINFDEETRMQMIERGSEQAKKFTWEKSAEKLSRVLKSIHN